MLSARSIGPDWSAKYQSVKRYVNNNIISTNQECIHAYCIHTIQCSVIAAPWRTLRWFKRSTFRAYPSNSTYRPVTAPMVIAPTGFDQNLYVRVNNKFSRNAHACLTSSAKRTLSLIAPSAQPAFSLNNVNFTTGHLSDHTDSPKKLRLPSISKCHQIKSK